MSYTSIEFSIRDAVARVILNRPDKLNSFNDQMHAELRDVLKTIGGGSDARCVLLTGRGRGFCAGQDLGDRHFSGNQAPDLGATLEKNYNRLVRTIASLEMPVVCAVNGVAAGAGANLALACDIVLAARSASFIQAFCKIGLIPDAGGTWILPRLVGHARARALALLGDRVSAEQAHAWGMIWECVDDAELAARAEELCVRLAAQATRGLALTKRALNASSANTLDAQLDLERDLQTVAGASDDYREGVAAFLEKRAAVFNGT